MSSASSAIIAAVDVGGTFTDIAVWDAGRAALSTHKLLTTPDDASRAIVDGLQALGLDPAVVVHGTTLVTNALIERRGAVVGLITTEGFRDVLEVANELRYDMFDLKLRRPEPIVPRRRRFTVPERVSSDGEVIVPLDLAAVAEAGRALRSMGCEALAVSFFNAYANPEHEAAAARILREQAPGVTISTSCEVSGEAREYERTSTAVANAYVQPLMEAYLAELTRRLGVPTVLFLMLSDGTISTLEAVRQQPVTLVESGPAAGTMAAAHLARECDWPAVMAFDMGGTTAKLSLVHDAQPQLTRSLEVARVTRFKKGSGLPLRVPTVDLLEIGAGGGSIARIDQLGLLKVGPESAGAVPGPACYGRGGVEPTVTDADLVLGYISTEGLVGGRLPLDQDLARSAIGRVAERLGMTITDTAAGIVDVVNTHMATAARIHLAEHGRDPRRYRLVAFGGAGPVHAFSVAALLGISEVIFPRDAGVASAIGMLVAPRGIERVRSWRCLLEQLDWHHLDGLLAELEAAGRAVIRQSQVHEHQLRVEVAADIRYAGQGHELTVTIRAEHIRQRDVAAIKTAFEDEYRRRYGLVLENLPVEIVSWRVRVNGPPVVDHPSAPSISTERSRSEGAPRLRRAYFRESGGLVYVPVRARGEVLECQTVRGPALIEEATTTCVVGPGWSASVDAAGNLVMRRTTAS